MQRGIIVAWWPTRADSQRFPRGVLYACPRFRKEQIHSPSIDRCIWTTIEKLQDHGRWVCSKIELWCMGAKLFQRWEEKGPFSSWMNNWIGEPLLPFESMTLPDRAGVKFSVWQWIRLTFTVFLPRIGIIYRNRSSVTDERLKSVCLALKDCECSMAEYLFSLKQSSSSNWLRTKMAMKK